MVVAGLAPRSDQEFQDDAFSRDLVEGKLREWRGVWLEHRDGEAGRALTRADIWRQIDMWLDELNDLKGR